METSFKRKIIQIAAVPGILSIILIWGSEFWFTNEISTFDQYSLPVLAISLSIVSTLFWYQNIPERVFDIITYLILNVYVITKFASVLLITYTRNHFFTTNFTLWLPFFFLLGFLILRTNAAVIGSAIVFCILLGMGILFVIQVSRNDIPIDNLSLLLQVYLASLLYIFIAFLLSKLQSRFFAVNSFAHVMSKLAVTDQLTGVPNRRWLDNALQEGIDQYLSVQTPFAVILFDLDNFKIINDRFGHAAGDITLKKVAQRCQNHVRKEDGFGRWGGDEFLCITFQDNIDHILELAERLRLVVEATPLDDGQITASFGVSICQENDNIETIIQRADVSLYQAKAKGKNRVEFYPMEKPDE